MDTPLLDHVENNDPIEWGTRYASLRLLRMGWWSSDSPEYDAAMSPARGIARDTHNALRHGEDVYQSMLGEGWHTSLSPSVSKFSATVRTHGTRHPTT